MVCKIQLSLIHKNHLKMNSNDVSPLLEKGKYFIEVNINYENGNIESESIDKILKGSSISNRIGISI